MTGSDQSHPRIKSGSLFVVGVISLFTGLFILLAAFVYYAWKKDRSRTQRPNKPDVHQRPWAL